MREDLEQIRFVTRHYGELKGLQGVAPLGLWLLAMGLATLFCQARDWSTAAVLSGLAIVWTTGAGVLYLSLRAGRRYRRIYGDVEQQHPLYMLFSSGLKNLAIWESLAVWGAVLMLTLALMAPLKEAFQQGRDFYLLNGLILLGRWWRQGRPIGRAYAAALGLALLGLAIGKPFSPRIGLPGALFLCGAVLILVGLLDHRQLVRVLQPVEQPERTAAESTR